MSASLHFSQKPQDQLTHPFGTGGGRTELFAVLLRFRSAWSINQSRQDPKNAAKKNARTHPRPKPPIALFGCCSASPTNAWPKLMRNWPEWFFFIENILIDIFWWRMPGGRLCWQVRLVESPLFWDHFAHVRRFLHLVVGMLQCNKICMQKR